MLAYIGSTLLVVLYVCYTIHTILQENVEEVQGAVSLVKTSELLKVGVMLRTSIGTPGSGKSTFFSM